MRALPRALIFAAQFLELSDDTIVDPDIAVRAMESIAHELSNSTNEERKALRSALDELIKETEKSDMDPDQRCRLQFYRDFMGSFHLEENLDNQN